MALGWQHNHTINGDGWGWWVRSPWVTQWRWHVTEDDEVKWTTLHSSVISGGWWSSGGDWWYINIGFMKAPDRVGDAIDCAGLGWAGLGCRGMNYFLKKQSASMIYVLSLHKIRSIQFGKSGNSFYFYLFHTLNRTLLVILWYVTQYFISLASSQLKHGHNRESNQSFCSSYKAVLSHPTSPMFIDDTLELIEAICSQPKVIISNATHSYKLHPTYHLGNHSDIYILFIRLISVKVRIKVLEMMFHGFNEPQL